MLTEAQLAMRRTAITGTDIGAICGLSEHRSALDVFLDKTHDTEPVDLTPALKRGIYLEDGILRWYVEDTGATEVERPGTLVHKHNLRIMATPDAVVLKPSPGMQYVSARTGVEVKAPGRFAEYGWGEPGTDQVPQAYLAQAVFEMAVLDVERLDFAALLGGELQVYPVQRNRDVEGKLIERALAFWRDHVETGKPPAPTWRPRDEEWIAKSFPRAVRPALEWTSLTPLQQMEVALYLEAHAEASTSEKRCRELELRVKMLLGDAGGLVGLPGDVAPYTRIDWRENEGGPVKWKRVAEALRAGKAWDEAVAENAGAAPRPFAPRKSKKGEE